MPSSEQLRILIENEDLHVDRLIRDAIDFTHTYLECVTLLGSRQIGKTTLARTYYESHLGGIFRDLQELDARKEVGTGSKFFEKHKNRTIILDAIQECEHLYGTIKVHIDRQRFARNKNCKFLLIGSANLKLQNKSVAKLAGRVALTEMPSITLLELISTLSGKIRTSSRDELLDTYRKLTQLLMLRGGMPLSLFAESTPESLRQRRTFVRNNVHSDIEHFGLGVNQVTIEKCLAHVATVNGKQFEIGTFTKKLNRAAQMVRDAMSALEQLLLLRVIEPWGEVNGRSAKLSKHTKVYLRDSGLITYLLKLKSVKSLIASRHIGSVWDGFVIESLIGTAQCAGTFENCYFYRTHKGENELDFVLEFEDGAIWGIEIKYSEPKALKVGNIEAAKTVGASRRLAIHNGTRSYTN